MFKSATLLQSQSAIAPLRFSGMPSGFTQIHNPKWYQLSQMADAGLEAPEDSIFSASSGS
jgi:hypothetical protein